MKRSYAIFVILLLTALQLSAQRPVDSMKRLLSATRSSSDSVKLIVQIGINYYNQQSKLTDSLALLHFEKAIDISSRTNNKKGKVLSLVWRATFYVNKDNTKANKLLNEAIASAKAINDTSDEAMGLVKLGVLYLASDNTKALSLFNESLRLYGLLHDSSGLARCWTQLGYLYSSIGEYKKAIEYNLYAMKVIEKNGTTMILGYLHMNIGKSHHDMGNYAVALEYDKKALAIFIEVKATKMIYVTMMNIAAIHEIRKEYNEAQKSYVAALELIRLNNDEQAMIGCMRMIGSMYVDMNDYKKAITYLEMALKKLEHVDDNIEHCYVLGVLSNAYCEEKNYSKALALSDEQIRIASANNLRLSLALAYRQKAKIYARLNDFSNAYQNKLYYESIQDSLFNEEKSKQIAEMQTKYETGRKAGEILLLNKDKEVMQTKISRKNLGILGVMSGGILVISLVVLLYNRRNLINQNKYEKEINTQQQQMTLAILSAQEEERQKIAKDMHDSLGAYLSSLKINMEVLQPVITEEKQPIYENALTALGKVTGEMRAIAKNLVSDTLQQYGLEIAVEELVELVNRSGKIKIDYTSDGFSGRLAPELETSVFRIVQELLNNTLKHAGATVIKLRLFENGESVSIEFEDNGVGFDQEKINDGRKGIGMKNMEARTKILKGIFNVFSRPGEGSYFKIQIPNTIS